MDGQKQKANQAIAQLIFDKVLAHPDFIKKSWTSDTLNDVFCSFRIEHIADFQPRRWFGISVINIECVFISAQRVDTAVVLSPRESLPFSIRLENSLSTIAAMGRKELPGDCELIMTPDLFSFDVRVILRVPLDHPSLIDQLQSFLSEFGVTINN